MKLKKIKEIFIQYGTPLFSLLIAVTLFVNAFSQEINKSVAKEYQATILYSLIALLFITGLILFGTHFVKYLVKDQETDYDKLKTQIYEVSSRVKHFESISRSSITNNDINIEDLINARIDTNVQSYFFSKFDSEIEREYQNKYSRELLENMLKPLERNTDKYISTLKKNSSINLLIGIAITTFALSILGYTVIFNITTGSWNEFLIHYIPRFSFVLFIQIFAFFFLRLYKTNLEDIKYFQNEATNISCKTSAIRMAQLFNIKEDLSTFLNELSKVERNFKLLNGETLLNLEKSKLETKFDLRVLELIKEFNFLKKDSNAKEEK